MPRAEHGVAHNHGGQAEKHFFRFQQMGLAVDIQLYFPLYAYYDKEKVQPYDFILVGKVLHTARYHEVVVCIVYHRVGLLEVLDVQRHYCSILHIVSFSGYKDA